MAHNVLYYVTSIQFTKKGEIMLIPLITLTLAALCGTAAAAPIINQSFDTCTSVSNCGAVVTYVTDGTSTSVNLRDTTNAINANGTNGFDKFFTSRFMTIGDNVSNDGISGEPNGQSNGGLSRASFNLGSLAAGYYNFQVAFDYVVDTNWPTTSQGTNSDDFNVVFETGTGVGLLANVMNFTDVPAGPTGHRGNFNQMVSFSLASNSLKFRG